MSEGKDFREDLEQKELQNLKPYALRSRERAGTENFREYETAPLEYRTEYHRDRDRIVWSKSFKRLQHKTQIFPHYVEDHYRRRLTHSLEVAQIATTVARALGLNEVATEAIALGHDLGHTPFGHAGEDALNRLLLERLDGLRETDKAFDPRSLPIPLFGFDHCVHAIEVVCRIEDEYSRCEPRHPGLNLSLDIRDGILKHMFEREHDCQRPHSFIPDVVQYRECSVYGEGKGSLEAQCVYFADKVAYLLGDIEDGIRCHIFKCSDLNADTFLQTVWNLYGHQREAQGQELAMDGPNDFLELRRRALTALILDCIEHASATIAERKYADHVDVLRDSQRVVCVQPGLWGAWSEFYDRWLRKRLFKHHDVIVCETKASKIVSDLFTAYLQQEDLIPERYRTRCYEVYGRLGITGDAILHLIAVRNYIAGMTDAFAIDQHMRLFSSSERIRF